jgi:CRP-like cAMP-binding protein
MANPALDFIQQYEAYTGQSCEKVSFKRGDFLIREGEIERYVYCIENGAVRAFYVGEQEEFTIRFGYPGSVLNSIGSFITGSPSEFFIQALRATTAKRIARSMYFEFIEHSQKTLHDHSLLLANVVVTQMEREIDLLTYSPIQRYKRVLQRSPQLFQEIPLKYIASYLRMTPETLSRLRNLDCNQEK